MNKIFEGVEYRNTSTDIESLYNSPEIGSYFFINTDEVDGAKIDYVSKKIASLVQDFSPEDIQVVYSGTTKSKDIASKLKEEGYDAFLSRDMAVGNIGKKSTVVRKTEALDLLAGELGSSYDDLIDGSSINWLKIRERMHTNRCCITIFGTTLSQNFIRYINQTNQDFEQIFYRLYSLSLGNGGFDEKVDTWKDFIYREQSDRKKVTIFVGEDMLERVMESVFEKPRQEEGVSPEDKRNKKILLPRRVSNGSISSFTKVPERSTEDPMVRTGIKIKNKLLQIYTNPQLLFTQNEQKEVNGFLHDIGFLLEKKNGRPHNPKIEGQIQLYKRLMREIVELVRMIKHTQIWHVIHNVRDHISALRSTQITFNEEVENTRLKRKNWGIIKSSMIGDNVREFVADIMNFLEAHDGSGSLQSLEELFSFNSDSIFMHQNGGKILEYLFVEILESSKRRTTKGAFEKGPEVINSALHTDFIYRGEEDSLDVGVQLYSGPDSNSRTRQSSFSKLKRKQHALDTCNARKEDFRVLDSDGNLDVSIPRGKLPQSIVLCDIEMSSEERKVIKERFYGEYSIKEDENILDGWHDDNISIRIKKVTNALEVIINIISNQNSKDFQTLLIDGINVGKTKIQGWMTDQNEAEVIISEKSREIGKVTIFDIGEIDIGNKNGSRKKARKPEKETKIRKKKRRNRGGREFNGSHKPHWN